MRILDLSSLSSSGLRAPVISVGNFDGIHVGHQEILRRVVEGAASSGADSLVVTFEPHPKGAFHHSHGPARLNSPKERTTLIAEMGIMNLAILEPTSEFLAQSPEAFVRDFLVGVCGVSRMVEGHDFRFGRASRGDLERLEELGRRYGFEVEVVPAVNVRGRTVSSTMIRSLLSLGEVERAAEALGRPYSIKAEVRQGDQRGREIGYPTANLVPVDRALPADGVYATRAVLGGRDYPSLTNVGLRPTFRKNERILEAHLLDFEGEFYGEELEVRFLRWIREEIAFPSLEDLAKQIRKDCERARQLLETSGFRRQPSGDDAPPL